MPVSVHKCSISESTLTSFIWDFEAYWCYSEKAETDEDGVLVNAYQNRRPGLDGRGEEDIEAEGT